MEIGDHGRRSHLATGALQKDQQLDLLAEVFANLGNIGVELEESCKPTKEKVISNGKEAKRIDIQQ